MYIKNNSCKAEEINLLNLDAAEESTLQDAKNAGLNENEQNQLTDSFKTIKDEAKVDLMICTILSTSHIHNEKAYRIFDKNFGGIERAYRLEQIIKALEPSQSK